MYRFLVELPSTFDWIYLLLLIVAVYSYKLTIVNGTNLSSNILNKVFYWDYQNNEKHFMFFIFYKKGLHCCIHRFGSRLSTFRTELFSQFCDGRFLSIIFSSMVCLKEELMISTGRGLLQRIFWADGRINTDVTIELASLPFSADLQHSRCLFIFTSIIFSKTKILNWPVNLVHWLKWRCYWNFWGKVQRFNLWRQNIQPGNLILTRQVIVNNNNECLLFTHTLQIVNMPKTQSISLNWIISTTFHGPPNTISISNKNCHNFPWFEFICPNFPS